VAGIPHQGQNGCWCDARDFCGRFLYYFGIWEPNLTALIQIEVLTGNLDANRAGHLRAINVAVWDKQETLSVNRATSATGSLPPSRTQAAIPSPNTISGPLRLALSEELHHHQKTNNTRSRRTPAHFPYRLPRHP